MEKKWPILGTIPASKRGIQKTAKDFSHSTQFLSQHQNSTLTNTKYSEILYHYVHSHKKWKEHLTGSTTQSRACFLTLGEMESNVCQWWTFLHFRRDRRNICRWQISPPFKRGHGHLMVTHVYVLYERKVMNVSSLLEKQEDECFLALRENRSTVSF